MKIEKIVPFAFQERVIEEGLAVLKDKKGRSEVLVAATAAGKSIVIAEIARRLPKDGNILVVQPSLELLKQNLKKIKSYGTNPSVYSSSYGSKEIGRITYATPLSLKYEDFKDKNIKYLIIDETELFTKNGSKLSTFKNKLKIKNILGLTASPVYLNSTKGGSKLQMINEVRGGFFKGICSVVQPSEMVKLGRWAKLKYKSYEFNNDGLVLNSSGTDYTEESLKVNYLEADLETKIIKLVNTIPTKEPILIFVSGTENVETLTKKLGNRSTCVHSKTPQKEREENIRKYLSGEVDIMVNNLIFTCGFDYPNLRHLIDGNPTKSIRNHIQKLGRLVRIYEGKEFGVVHDLVGNVDRFGKVEDINVDFIEGFGWGLFSNDLLLSEVPLNENWKITKEQLKEYGEGAVSKIQNELLRKYDTIIPFGKHKGSTLLKMYHTNKMYLSWLINPNTGFDFSRYPQLHQSLKNIFNGV